jgi:hypothetical protein
VFDRKIVHLFPLMMLFLLMSMTTIVLHVLATRH